MTRASLCSPSETADSMLRDVLFDVDGVLVHPWRFRDYLIREHGIGPETTKPFFRGAFVRCVTGRADLFEELPPFLDAWGWRESVAAFVEAWLREEDALNGEVLSYVDELRKRGVRCHVASTQERHRAAYLAGEMALADHFDSLLFSCDLGAAKPDGEFFALAQRRLGLPVSRLLLVDDAAGNVAEAQRQGWKAVHYVGLESLTEVQSNLEVTAG